jgi:hypothetical protein
MSATAMTISVTMTAAMTFAMTMTAAMTFAMTMTATMTITVTLTMTFAFAMSTAATTAILAATATSTFTAHSLYERSHFLSCSLVAFEDRTLEVKSFASPRVVEVYSNLVVTNLYDISKEALALSILQWHDSTFEDILVVEFAIVREYSLIQVENSFSHVLAISLLRSQGDIIVFACLLLSQEFLKFVESHSHARDESEWNTRLSLLEELLFAICNVVKLICSLNVLISHFTVVFLLYYNV